jgi:ASC-1-like (ASCH) protein
MKSYTLPISARFRPTFNALRDGEKKVETRAATKRYADIAKGDTLVFSCGKSKKFSKKVTKVEKFRSIGALYRKYKPHHIDPSWKTEAEGRKAWASFPNYTEKIKEYGLIAVTLK